MDNSRNNYENGKNYNQIDRKYSAKKVENVKIISTARAQSFKRGGLNSSRVSKYSNAHIENSFLQRSFANNASIPGTPNTTNNRGGQNFYQQNKLKPYWRPFGAGTYKGKQLWQMQVQLDLV